MAAFPTSAESLDEWLQTIKMAKYAPTLAAANVHHLDQLHTLTDDALKAAGIKMVGHRTRLLQAAAAFAAASQPPQQAVADTAMADAPTLAPHEPFAPTPMKPAPVAAPKRSFNSTSSVFINSTISKPDEGEILFCVAVCIHDRIVQGEEAPASLKKRFAFFSEETNPMYAGPKDDSMDESHKRLRREFPSEEVIYHTIRSVFECAHFPFECVVVSLIYVERLIDMSNVPILVTSWRPIVLASMILAQKVWDDRSLFNIEFSIFCPMLTLKEINHLEKKFLELIDYDVSVNASLYASYYFQLRTLCQSDAIEKVLDPKASARLEVSGAALTEKLRGEHTQSSKKNWSSSADIPSVGSLNFM